MARMSPADEVNHSLARGAGAARALDLSKIAGPPRWRWYHGALFYLFAQALTAGLNGLATFARTQNAGTLASLSRGDTRWSDTLRRPIFQPPNWLFPIAWPINNIAALWGTLRALNKPARTPGRDAYLALQGATWLDYAVFSGAYFGLRSPINGFLLTLIYLALTVASGLVALFRLKDTQIALSLATTFVWLLVALPSGLAQALWNRDELYHAGPFATPSPRLERRALNGDEAATGGTRRRSRR